MEIFVSTWMPWRVATWPQNRSIAEQINLASALGADAISMKGVNGIYVYGKKEALTWPYNKSSNDDLEQDAKLKGMDVALWCWVDCKYPERQARAVRDAVARWNPIAVKFDVEGGVAKKYAYNTGPFLRSLGPLRRHDGTRVRAYLQSYRRPDLHPLIAWKKWLTYKDQDGDFILDGVAPQAYYMGTQDSAGDYEKMLAAHRKLEREIGRKLLWHVTLPTFAEHGWAPTAESLKDGIDFLRAELGAALVGVDYWRLGWLLTEGAKDVLAMLLNYDWGGADPPQPPAEFLEMPEPARWAIVRDDLKDRGIIGG